MCVSVGGASSYSGTILYAGAQQHPDSGKNIHVLGYSVSAKNHDPHAWMYGGPQEKGAPGRALFIAVPARPGTLGAANFIDTTDFDQFMVDQQEQICPETSFSRGGFSFGAPMAAGYEGEVTITEVGKFVVVAAQNARDIYRALEEVPEEKRPQDIPAAFCQHMQSLYGGEEWSYVLACYGDDMDDRATFLFWYEPQNENELFLPGLDEHTGKKLPVPTELVNLDHVIIVAGPNLADGTRVEYSQPAANDCPYVAKEARGFDARAVVKVPNGDFAVAIADLAKPGTLQVRRRMPPGAFLDKGFVEPYLEPAEDGGFGW